MRCKIIIIIIITIVIFIVVIIITVVINKITSGTARRCRPRAAREKNHKYRVRPANCLRSHWGTLPEPWSRNSVIFFFFAIMTHFKISPGHIMNKCLPFICSSIYNLEIDVSKSSNVHGTEIFDLCNVIQIFRYSRPKF